jgi:hypothetical protein
MVKEPAKLTVYKTQEEPPDSMMSHPRKLYTSYLFMLGNVLLKFMASAQPSDILILFSVFSLLSLFRKK